MNKLLIIIPARFASTRFPGKPLALIGGKPMLQRVWEQTQKVKGFETQVLVATDDIRIQKAADAFGAISVLTSESHPSGTDRCFEAASKTNFDFNILINVQGDEPFIQAQQIEDLANNLLNSNAEIATLKRKIDAENDISNPNIVKVVSDNSNNALYFSRSTIPFKRDSADKTDYYRHLGIYAFKKSCIAKLENLLPTTLEEIEKLEQLRWLQNGFKILLVETDFQSPAVDCPEDLVLVENFLKDNPTFG